MINKVNLHAYLNTVLLILMAVAGLFYFSENNTELVYVDNIKLFNDFNMTKDIKQLEGAKINNLREELDSLYVIYNEVRDKNSSEFKSVQQRIANKSKSYQELQDNYSHNLSNDIRNRLNQYIKEYAEANSIKIILGSSGAGNVMYADKLKDVTKQVLEYSNQKYEGHI